MKVLQEGLVMLPGMIPASEIRAAVEEAFKQLPEIRRMTPQEQNRLLRALRRATYFSPAVKVGEYTPVASPE